MPVPLNFHQHRLTLISVQFVLHLFKDFEMKMDATRTFHAFSLRSKLDFSISRWKKV